MALGMQVVCLLALSSLAVAAAANLSIGTRIINGDDARSEYRFTVRLAGYRYNARTFCTGALLNYTHVITTATCLNGMSMVEVYAGDIQLNDGEYVPNSGTYKRKSNRWTVHPEWRMGSHAHDLAIVQLNNGFFGNMINTIALPTSKSDEMDDLRVTGWGYTQTQEVYSEVLQYSEVHLQTAQNCDNHNQAYPQGHFLCKDPYQQSTVFTCKGDEGGPLFNNDFQLVGVMTYRANWDNTKDCSKAVTVFTEILPYVQWITDPLVIPP